ncbi:MAG: methyl-accepting chemotaxis protein [Eubacteriales bacterium]
MLKKSDIQISNIIRKQAINLITQIAKKIENILNQVERGDWSQVVAPLRKVIEENIGDNEFLVLNSLDGQALVHSNSFREGRFITKDELGVVRSTKPITQIYHRDTGEVLLDVISPILVNGKHLYALRMGIPIRKSKLAHMFILGTIPLLILGGGWIANSLSPIAIGFTTTSLFLWVIYSYLFHHRIISTLNESFRVTKAITRGNLTLEARPQSCDELSALAYEVNKVNKGIKSIISDMDEVSQKSQNISKSQAIHTKALADSYEYLAALFQEFSAGSIEQIEGMRKAEEQVNEIKAASQRIRHSTLEVQSASNSAKHTSQEGIQAVNDIVQEMELISESTNQANNSIRSLEEQASKIGEIVSLINGISDQTNLLALNAAIEAARAGEHGRGFSVVAEEIRKLANDSSKSANQIMELIVNVQNMVRSAAEDMKKGISKVENGKSIIKKAGNAINLLDEVINTTGQKVQENLTNADYLQTQSESLAAVQNNATSIASQFSTAAQQAASTMDKQMKSTQEVAIMAESLADTSTQLDNYIKRFTF